MKAIKQKLEACLGNRSVWWSRSLQELSILKDRETNTSLLDLKAAALMTLRLGLDVVLIFLGP